MNKTTITLVMLIVAKSLTGQTFQLSGSLLDENSQVVEFATVGLFNSTDSTLINGTIANSEGEFVFDGLSTGEFYIYVSHLLYLPSYTSLKIDADMQLEPIHLVQSAQELEELVVTGQRASIQTDIGKITVNPDQILSGRGGNATDVLKSIPIVNVSPEGSLSIRGGGDIQILVNGKPSGMVAVQGSQFLNQIDASVIERIEVITSPSAKHGSDGGSGIINVILKKEKTDGLNGNVLLSIANRDRYTISPSISYRKEKVNLFLRYSQLQNTRRTNSSGNETRNDSIAIVRSGLGRFKDLRHNVEIGSDYFLDDRKYLTIAGLFRYRDKSSTNRQVADVSHNGIQQENRRTSRSEPENNNGYGVTISYFAENDDETKKTEILLDVVHSVEDETVSRVDDLFRVPENEQSFVGAASHYIDVNDGIFFDAALIRPIPNGKLDVGARYFYRNIDQDFSLNQVDENTGQIEVNPDLEDIFRYNDHVAAIYGEVNKDLGKFKLGIGLRVEYSVNNYATASVDETFSNTFFNLFPSVLAGYRFSESILLQFNYNRRINRPAPNRLNPFPDIGNPFSIGIGNPDLQPEFIDSYNLGYSRNFTRSTLIVNAFLKVYHDYIQRISVIDDEGLNTVSPVNLDRFMTYGFDISYAIDFTEKWEANIGLVSFRNDFSSSEEAIDNTGFTSQLKLVSSCDIGKKLTWQISAFWNSPEANSQGERLHQYYLDQGLNYEWIADKADITLSVSDVFNTLEEVNLTGIETLQARSYRKVDTRIFRLSFNYKI